MVKSEYPFGVILLLAGVLTTLSAICLVSHPSEKLTLSLHQENELGGDEDLTGSFYSQMHLPGTPEQDSDESDQDWRSLKRGGGGGRASSRGSYGYGGGDDGRAGSDSKMGAIIVGGFAALFLTCFGITKRKEIAKCCQKYRCCSSSEKV